MPKRKVAVVIPARMASSRFPGKPLAKILDLPMIEHVRRRARLSRAVDDVYVATCDEEIFEAVTRYGGHALMTANTHERCTDRVQEAARGLEHEIIIIVQGDEPLFEPRALEILLEPMQRDDTIYCTNLLSVIHDEEDLSDIDTVKAVLNQKGFIMYFSRSPIPYLRVQTNCPMYRQTGISAFTSSFLNRYSSLPPTPLEIAESVDFLRILEHGYSLLGVAHDRKTVGVERKSDVGIVEKILKEDPLQQRIYQKILES
jgi:3-deoxy-manno-octulosonate cytidylyltransferase (CMP-KDO synthetase)